MSQIGSPLVDAMVDPIQPSRSTSPRFNITDFQLKFPPHVAISSASTRDTSYASQSAIEDLDYAAEDSSISRPGKGVNKSFFSKRLLPRVVTSHLPASPVAVQTSSALTSPTKSLSSFISKSSDIPSSASRASVRASKVLFDNFFSGTSNSVHLGPAQPQESLSHRRSSSSVSAAALDRYEESSYEPEFETVDMGYTRAPVIPSRFRHTSTSDGTYASKLGAWLSNSSKALKTQAPISSEEQSDDPLLNLDVQQSLFPYGPVDPLNPSSFNDLLAAAEATIATYQNAYRQRVAELNNIRSQLALKEDEIEERETRAQHLKMQLQDLSGRCTAQEQRADILDGMLRNGATCDHSQSRVSSRSGSIGGHDSGFESDGDSVHSATYAEISQQIGRKDDYSPAQRRAQSPPSSSGDLARENQMLRIRVAELEGAVDSCLDMVSGPWALP